MLADPPNMFKPATAATAAEAVAGLANMPFRDKPAAAAAATAAGPKALRSAPGADENRCAPNRPRPPAAPPAVYKGSQGSLM